MGATLQQLQKKARQCQELADTAMTEEARLVLREMARNYETEAAEATARPNRVRVSELSA
jgi:hypothetical protein